MARQKSKQQKSIRKQVSPRINWSDELVSQIIKEELPLPEREYKFHPTRRWRFDLAFIKEKLAVEIEGAVWTYGRHTRGSGFIKDMEKYNEACYYGWYMARFTPNDVKTGVALKYLMRYFKGVEFNE
ncbi:MAG: hypothetical protein Unbinned834contig1000_44 [Prokaryotic dsDNA virus sp.]|nr:MAG: hypothetical protein Unbinned834contig1000_44 [Prokaryotic dsDNA virus sp.]|tara:strand:- start:32212 stop:32592 length:381 start_codon:yes stop_codon:yes gene_type:complete